MKTIITKGKTVEEAIQKALEELGTTADKVTTNILETPTTGIMGLFSNKGAKVEVTLKQTEEDILCGFLSGIFNTMEIEVGLQTRYEEDILFCDIDTQQTGVIIGRRGQTLDALQYLASLVVNKENESYTKISLDVAGYREKRKRALQDLADKIATSVQKRRHRFELEPMNPYERRIIHASLQNYKDIATYSKGVEPNRFVVIEYKREKI